MAIPPATARCISLYFPASLFPQTFLLYRHSTLRWRSPFESVLSSFLFIYAEEDDSHGMPPEKRIVGFPADRAYEGMGHGEVGKLFADVANGDSAAHCGEDAAYQHNHEVGAAVGIALKQDFLLILRQVVYGDFVPWL